MLKIDWSCVYQDAEDVPYVFWHILNSLYKMGCIPRNLQDIALSILVRQDVVEDTTYNEERFMEWLSMAIPIPYHPVVRRIE